MTQLISLQIKEYNLKNLAGAEEEERFYLDEIRKATE